jgi:hypothetical protein
MQKIMQQYTGTLTGERVRRDGFFLESALKGILFAETTYLMVKEELET